MEKIIIFHDRNRCSTG